MKKSIPFMGRSARCSYAFTWTVIVAILLLKPADKHIVEMSFENFLVSFFSVSFNTWDFIEAIYHIIIFASLTALWYWALLSYFSHKRTLLVVISAVSFFGLATEVGQYFVHRSSLMLDALANFLGIALFVVWINRSRSS